MKKYSFKINFIADPKLVIPEYKIELLNKSKKVIDTFEKINKINISKSAASKRKEVEKVKTENKSTLKKTKRTKTIRRKTKKLRTLWVRKKKKLN